MRKTLTLQDRSDGKCKRTEVLGIPALTPEQGKAQRNTHGAAAMHSRIRRLEHQHKLNDIRHKAGVITDAQYNRSVSRNMRRLRNIQSLAERIAPSLDYIAELARYGLVPCPSLCRAMDEARRWRSISDAECRAIEAAVQADRSTTGAYHYKCEQFAHLSTPDMHVAHRQWADKLLEGIDKR